MSGTNFSDWDRITTSWTVSIWSDPHQGRADLGRGAGVPADGLPVPVSVGAQGYETTHRCSRACWPPAPSAGFRLPLVHAADYRGKLFVFVQADGGWDPTSFCDPKANTPGEPVINHWAKDDEVRQAGNIPYAPFARNEAFFEKYHRRMLVINGVDAQTNSHTVGVVHNWSGRNSEGYPTTTALLAAHYAPDLPVPYLSFGGFSATAGHSPASPASTMRTCCATIAAPALTTGEHTGIPTSAKRTGRRSESLPGGDRRTAGVGARTCCRATSAPPGVLPLGVRHRGAEGLRGRDSPRGRARAVRRRARRDNSDSTLRRQAQLTVLAFKTGSRGERRPLARGIRHPRLPRPADHEWLFGNLTDSVDYLWEYAEEHGVADRMVVVIGSDFGRTNFYNAQDGKDHWPIGSFIVMEKNQPWTGRAVGETDGLHFAHRIDPRTLRRDDAERDHHLSRSTCTRRFAGTSASSTPPARSASRSTTPKTSPSSPPDRVRNRHLEAVVAQGSGRLAVRLLANSGTMSRFSI